MKNKLLTISFLLACCLFIPNYALNYVDNFFLQKNQ